MRAVEADGDRALGVCAAHAGRDASAACSRCGTFACAECLGWLEGRPYCPPCWHRVSYREEGRGSLAALWTGVIAIFCCPALAPVAIHLGRQELRLIDERRSPLGGQWNARAAVWLGWTAVALFVLAMLGMACLWGVGASLGSGSR